MSTAYQACLKRFRIRADGRLCLSAVPHKRFGGLAGSIEKGVAARCGRNLAAPIDEIAELNMSCRRSNSFGAVFSLTLRGRYHRLHCLDGDGFAAGALEVLQVNNDKQN
jgi:hypothetical protein